MGLLTSRSSGVILSAAARCHAVVDTETAERRGGAGTLVTSSLGCTCLADADGVSVVLLLLAHSVLIFLFLFFFDKL